MVDKICRYVIYEAKDVLSEGYSIPDPEGFFGMHRSAIRIRTLCISTM